MTRVAIVTDSTAYLPRSLVEQYRLHVIPLYLMFGQEVLRDNVDITPDAFYQRLSMVKNGLPTTSQPSAGDFCELYKRVAQETDAIVSIHISSLLSGTVASALQAKAMCPEVPIYVVDSLSTSMGLGYVVLAAARAREAGAGPEEMVAAAEAIIPKLQVYFVVDTLRYLHMGGRIGGASVLLGSALDIKPILQLRGGRIEPAGKVRTMKRAIPYLVDMVVKQLGEGASTRAAVLHAAAPDDAQQLRQLLEQRLNCVEMHSIEVSPVIGTHTGPGTVGAIAHLA